MKKINFSGFSKSKTNQLSFGFNSFKKTVLMLIGTASISLASLAQTPSYGNSGFNNNSFDQVPFASGSAYPSVMNATNVAGTGWSFHIGAIGAYTITQADRSATSTYNGTITATHIPIPGNPKFYQTFAFTSTNSSLFKLNSVAVKIDNSSATPIAMLLAGVVNGQNTGSTVPFLAMPGSNWTTITTSSNPNFTNINGVIIINVTGSASVAEMSFDDINISAPIVQLNIPAFTTQPTNKTVCAGTTATFMGNASNAATYFWLMSTDGLIWNPIDASNAGSTFSGYNTKTLTVSNPSVALNGLYLGLTAVNTVGVNKGSNAVRLYVNATPTVAAITGSSSVCAGSTIALANATASGVWSNASGYATVNTSGVVTGSSAGTANIRYTVTSGGCSAFAAKTITVNPLPAIPSIAYAAPFNNPQAGAPTGGWCIGKTFGVAGTPAGGVWSASGAASITLGGLCTVNTATAGSITYTYTNLNGCTSSRTMSGTGFACVARGVVANNKLQNSTEFTLFPNPAKNAINFSVPTLVGEGKIIVSDLYGKQLKSQSLSMGNNTVDIATLSKGLYFVSVITTDGKKTQKLIVE